MRGWAGVGACSAEGVGDGRNLAKIGFRRPLRVKDSSEAEAGGRSRKPVKQHICCFYWLTRAGEVAAVGRGRIFGT